MNFEPKPVLNPMITKHIVFGQSHKHPVSGESLRTWTVKVQAPDSEKIRKIARQRFGVMYSRIILHPEEPHFPDGVYETLIWDEDSEKPHAFKGDYSNELIKKKDLTFNEEHNNIPQHYNTPKPKRNKENHEHKKNQKPVGERTERVEGQTQRSEEQASGGSDQKGSSDEDSGGYDYLS